MNDTLNSMVDNFSAADGAPRAEPAAPPSRAARTVGEAAGSGYGPTRALTAYRPFWAKRFGAAPFLPMSRAEMDALGWDSCDIVIVTGDAYVDHPSFGMALIGRALEAQGFRVGIIAQPDWQSAEPFRALGRPNLFFGVTAGNMDSMINRYTADRKIRSDDAYTPGGLGGRRPDRCSLVYAQRCREAYNDVPLIMGGIEGSLRRIAALRLLAGQGAPLDRGRRQVRPAAVRQCRARHRRDRAPARGPRTRRTDPRRARHGLRAAPVRGRLVRDRFDGCRRAARRAAAGQSVPESVPDDRRTCRRATGRAANRRPRQAPSRRRRLGARGADAAGARRTTRAAARPHRHPPAVLRAGTRRSGAVRARQSDIAPGDQPGQRARAGAGARRGQHRARRVDQPAADSADDGRDGRRLRPAVCARAAPELRRSRRPGQDPGLGDDPLQREHHARLLRWLHLLFDHRARGPHHPEPQRGLDPARSRADPRQRQGFHGRDLRPGRADGQYVPYRLQVAPRSRPRAASRRAFTRRSARTCTPTTAP